MEKVAKNEVFSNIPSVSAPEHTENFFKFSEYFVILFVLLKKESVMNVLRIFLGLEEISQTKFTSFLFEIIALLFLYWCSLAVTAFCNPTVWAAVIFIYCIVFYISTIFFDTNKIPAITGFSFGLLCTTFTYLLIFVLVGENGDVGLFILGFPFTLLVFHILSRTITKCFVKTSTLTKSCFFIPIIIGCAIAFVAGHEFKKAASTIEKTPVEQYETLPNDFMTEHIVGMHFKYYTKTCIWDGWRPPVHEPLFVLGLWMNKMKDPLQVASLRERVELYIKLYPNKPYKMKCSCNGSTWHTYELDDLWNDLPPAK